MHRVLIDFKNDNAFTVVVEGFPYQWIAIIEGTEDGSLGRINLQELEGGIVGQTRKPICSGSFGSNQDASSFWIFVIRCFKQSNVVGHVFKRGIAENISAQ